MKNAKIFAMKDEIAKYGEFMEIILWNAKGKKSVPSPKKAAQSVWLVWF